MVFERAQEIALSLMNGGMFPCHKTTTAGGADHGQEQWCAGALGTMQNEGTVMGNQMARIAGRLGMIRDPAEHPDLEKMYDSLDAWVKCHSLD